MKNLMFAILCGTALALEAASAGTAERPTDVYLLIGQSNMAGRGTLTPSNRVNAARVMRWEASSNVWERAEEPIVRDRLFSGAGLGASFGRLMADADPKSVVGLVPAADGGTPLKRWMPGADLYVRAVKWTKDALAGGGRLKGILWHQGCNDAGTDADARTYAERLEKMVAALRRDLGEPDVRFVAGELGTFLDGYKDGQLRWREINRQLHLAAARIPNMAVVSSEGLADKGDSLHFDADATASLGARYAVEFRGRGTFGVSPETVAEYWAGERARLDREVPADVRCEPCPEIGDAAHDAYRISSATFNGKRVYGFMSVPRGEGPYPLYVSVPGAGKGEIAAGNMPGVIRLVLNVFDYDVGTDAKIAAERYRDWVDRTNAKYGVRNYMHAGLGRGREEYVFHDVILGMLRTIDWAAGRPKADPRRVLYFGSSQGGAFGLWLAAFGARFSKIVLNVLAMCDLLAFRDGRECGGPDPVRGQCAAERAVAEAAAPYYDAALVAPLVKAPVRMIVCLDDHVCPYATAVTAFGRLANPESRLFAARGLGHSYGSPFFAPCLKWLMDDAR